MIYTADSGFIQWMTQKTKILKNSAYRTHGILVCDLYIAYVDKTAGDSRIHRSGRTRQHLVCLTQLQNVVSFLIKPLGLSNPNDLKKNNIK